MRSHEDDGCADLIFDSISEITCTEDRHSLRDRLRHYVDISFRRENSFFTDGSADKKCFPKNERGALRLKAIEFGRKSHVGASFQKILRARQDP